MHRIFVCGKGRKHVIADSALKRIQVDARSRRLNADQHHLGFALRTGGALKWSRRNGGRQGLGLGHGASLHKRREHNTLGHRYCPGRGPAMEQVYAAGNSAASQFGPLAPIAPALTPVFAAQLKEDGMSRRQQKNAQTHEAAADEPSPARLPIVPTRTSPYRCSSFRSAGRRCGGGTCALRPVVPSKIVRRHLHRCRPMVR